ncbi:TPA: hypothetical protein ACH3X2_011685 [Trebouxia sp. C0005]|nr:MAG: hypothetical protein FRX49_01049 [Trebouxia sp. A1-2]
MLWTCRLAAAILISVSFHGATEGKLSRRQEKLINLTAEDAVERLCKGQVSATEYAEALLAQNQLNECLNNFAALQPHQVLADARAVDELKASGHDTRPLCGLPFAVKDNIDVVGYPTVAGTPALHGMRPTNSSPVVTRLLEAHGVVLGKTHMEELAEGLTTINPVYGPVLNPYNNEFDVGGSSGGTGGVVSARGAPGGFCSDTAGSCRIPGAHTGTVGFRPSLGCYNAAGGIVPQTTSRDTVGVMARTVKDVILFDSIFSDCHFPRPDLVLKGTRLGYPVNYWKGLDTRTVKTFEAALEALVAAGVELVEFDMGLLTAEGAEIEAELLLAYEMPREVSRYLSTHRYNISLMHLVDQIASPYPKALMEQRTSLNLDAWPTPADYYFNIREVIPKLKELHDMFLNAYNVHLTVTPTTHLPAGPIAQVQPWVMYNGKLVDTFDAYGQTVFLGPPLGIPAISIPIGLSTDGLPLGIHFQARPEEDGLLLAFSAAVEKVLPPMPAPPFTPACQGCTPKVKLQAANYSGVGQPGRDDVTSLFTLHFEGQCELKHDIEFAESSSVHTEL